MVSYEMQLSQELHSHYRYSNGDGVRDFKPDKSRCSDIHICSYYISTFVKLQSQEFISKMKQYKNDLFHKALGLHMVQTNHICQQLGCFHISNKSPSTLSETVIDGKIEVQIRAFFLTLNQNLFTYTSNTFFLCGFRRHMKVLRLE